eukprot:scaffold1307_cov512-Pavlova_lutheri.AAC.2
MGLRWTHAKIQRHPSRNDEMDTLPMGRRHPARGPTKAGQDGPRVGSESDANGTNGPCQLRWMGLKWTHAKIQLHPSRNDEMDEALVGRQHLAPGSTKAGP